MTDRFDRARELFLSGIVQFEAGGFEAAAADFEASLALVPGRASTLANLGATRLQLGEPEAALNALEQALAVEPADLDAWSHKGLALAALGRHQEALACHDNVLSIDRQRAPNWLHRGNALNALGRPEEAFICYEKAVGFDPTLADAWSHRGGMLRDMGRLDEAASAFEQALVHGADRVLNGYFLAAVTGREAPARAPADYVEPLFDDYAATYDAHLLQALKYRAHTVLVENLRVLDQRRYRSALDLGCGTGLCGALVDEIADEIEGVDLSHRMLEQARSLGVYDRLVHAEIAEYLQLTDRRFDLVLAADVFIYVGDLEPVFAGVRRVGLAGGVFCFSVEPASDDKDFELLPSLRYAHAERRIRELAARHRFELLRTVRAPLREDQRRPVQGLFAYLRMT